MNARPETSASPSPVFAGRAEHIAIEAGVETESAPAKDPHRITRCSYALRSRLRGCSTELSIFEGHYLGVRSVRAHAPALKYQFDLRFANPQPVRVRSIAWTRLVVAIGLALLGAAALIRGWTSPAAPWTALVVGGAMALCLSGAAGYLFMRGTSESLEFRSVHGAAPLVSVMGGIGAARAGKPFFIEVIKSIQAAKLMRPQTKAQFLRDEMREHHRLRELNVLTEQEYEASKVRILAAH